MIEAERDFWRGYLPLLLALGAAQLTQQADILMVSRLGGGASGAYVLLSRLAIFETVLMAAMGAVASTIVAKARRDGETAQAIGRTLGLAALVGLCCCALGLSLYSGAAKWLAGEGEVAAFVAAGVFWHALAAPLRFLTNTAAFMLHALGQGASVVRWKLIEVAAKAAGNFLIMEILGLGFAGCFLSGLIIAAISSLWCRRLLFPRDARWISVPGCSWALKFLRSTAWEAQRIISSQLAVLACLALFAAPWLGNYDVSRLNAYAAGQTFMLIVFAPFMAQVRFLAFRLAAQSDAMLGAPMWTIFLRGAPVATGAALILFAGHGWLGRLYGQQGPWWSMLIQALAISLPLRFVANWLRAMLQSQGAFASVAAADSAALWLLGTPLVALGLYADSPGVAYLSLIVPEAASAVWLCRRLLTSRRPDLANARPLGLRAILDCPKT
jgi:hypothetical protein